MNTERLLAMIRAQQQRIIETLKQAKDFDRDPLTRQLIELCVAELSEVKTENVALKKQLAMIKLKNRYNKAA